MVEAVKKAKKVAKKVAKKTAKKSAAKTAAAPRPKSTCSVEDIVKLMQRKGGATIEDMHAAGFWQPAIAAVKAAERRELKPKITKKEGEKTVYSCNK